MRNRMQGKFKSIKKSNQNEINLKYELKGISK